MKSGAAVTGNRRQQSQDESWVLTQAPVEADRFRGRRRAGHEYPEAVGLELLGCKSYRAAPVQRLSPGTFNDARPAFG